MTHISKTRCESKTKHAELCQTWDATEKNQQKYVNGSNATKCQFHADKEFLEYSRWRRSYAY